MTVEPIRKLLPYTTIAVVIAALYVAYTFYSRRDTEQKVERAEAARQAESDRASVDRVGGGGLKILQFYASPPMIEKGAAGKLCYGVAFAKTVTIEPETEAVWPSLGRCIDVKPAKTTHYTLTARDSAGHQVTQSVDVTIQ